MRLIQTIFAGMAAFSASACLVPSSVTHLSSPSNSSSASSASTTLGGTSPLPSPTPSQTSSNPVAPAPPSINTHYSSIQGNVPPGGSFPYFPNSPFHVPLPANPVFVSDAQSATWNQQNSPSNFGDFTVSEDASSGNDGGDPINYTDGDGTTFNLACNKTSYSAYVCGINAYNPHGLVDMNGTNVSFPLHSIPAGDSDHHISSINTLEGYEDDIWLGSPFPTQAGATWSIGGAGRCALNGDGTGCAGATATNMALSMGIIRAEDILYCLNSSANPESCTLPYALAIAPKCNGKNFTYPATASDGQCFDSSGTNHSTTAGLPEGSRGCVNLTDAQINALPYPAYEKVVLRTADCQHFGMFVRDSNYSGGPGFAWQFSGAEAFSAFGHTDPWRKLANQVGIAPSGDGSNFFFTMSDLKAPPIRWCANSKNNGLCD